MPSPLIVLAKRILVEHRRFVLPLTIALGVNVVFYAVAVYPPTVRVSNAEQRAVAAEGALGTARAVHSSASERSDDKDRANAELRRFYQDVLPVGAAGARRIMHARLADLAERSNLRYERATSDQDRDRESPLARLHTTMVLDGDYWDIRRFIHQLETAPEFVVIEEVSLEQGEESDTNLVLTLSVSTYYWLGPDGA